MNDPAVRLLVGVGFVLLVVGVMAGLDRLSEWIDEHRNRKNANPF